MKGARTVVVIGWTHWNIRRNLNSQKLQNNKNAWLYEELAPNRHGGMDIIWGGVTKQKGENLGQCPNKGCPPPDQIFWIFGITDISYKGNIANYTIK